MTFGGPPISTDTWVSDGLFLQLHNDIRPRPAASGLKPPQNWPLSHNSEQVTKTAWSPFDPEPTCRHTKFDVGIVPHDHKRRVPFPARHPTATSYFRHFISSSVLRRK